MAFALATAGSPGGPSAEVTVTSLHTPNLTRWHWMNIVLHGLNTVLVLALLARGFEWQAAIMGAVLFAAHPLATSAVCPLAGRFTLLGGAFYLMAMIAALMGFGIIAILLFLGAIASKEEAWMWPAAAGVTVWLLL